MMHFNSLSQFFNNYTSLICILAPCPLLFGLFLPIKILTRYKKGSVVSTVLWLARFSALFAALSFFGKILQQKPIEIELTLWGPIAFTLYFDMVSAIMLLLVAFLTLSVVKFSRNYLAGNPRQDLFFKWLAITSGNVFLLLISGNLILFSLAWIGVSLSLHKLLTFYKDRYEANLAARKKFHLSRWGDIALVTAIVLVWHDFGTLNFQKLFAIAEHGSFAHLELVALLLVTAAMIKSAQFPFHGWLPDTMETPTPVSALMHAGIINAGGFLVIRLSPLLVLSPQSLEFLAAVGGFTALFGSVVMITQSNLKRSLAFSTIAQMGFMMLQCALGAFALALLHIVAHSLYKAFAFLSSGKAIDESRNMGTLPKTKYLGIWGILVCFFSSVAIVFGFSLLLDIQPWSDSGKFSLTLILAIAIAQFLFHFWSSDLSQTFHPNASSVCGGSMRDLSTCGCNSKSESAITAENAHSSFAIDKMTGAVTQTENLIFGISQRGLFISLAISFALTLLFIVLHAGTEVLISNDVALAPVFKMAWPIGVITAFFFLMIALRPFLRPSWVQTKIGKALFIHAYNGFYINTLTNRILNRPLSSLVTQKKKKKPTKIKPLHSTSISVQESINNAVEIAIKRIPPLWPLSRFVAVNPFVGLSSIDFSEAASLLRKTAGISLSMPPSFYRERYKSETGIITDQDLYKAIEEVTKEKRNVDKIFSDLLSALNKNSWEYSENPSESKSNSLIHSADRMYWSSFIAAEVSKWCVAFFDQGQALWAFPWKDQSLFSGWKEAASIDLNIEVAGIKGWRNFVRSLPKDPLLVIEKGVNELGIREEEVADHLHALLLTIPGWAGYMQFLDHEKVLRGGRENSIIDLLAIRLVYEVAIKRSFGELLNIATHKNQNLLASFSSLPEAIWQRAHECAMERELFKRLSRSTKNSEINEIPFQAIFCIDVRSETYRRSLEKIAPKCQTIGFAGFFGFPIEFIKIDQKAELPQCPVLLKPSVKVVEVPSSSDHLILKKKISYAWTSFKSSAVSSFVFVELVGIGFFFKMMKSLLHRSVKNKLTNALSTSLIPLEQQVETAAGALRHMGLAKGTFSRIVLLCGHGSSTENNPYGSSLDCGACGGHSGEANARTAVMILNNPDVRTLLAQRNIAIPKETIFVAGLHNTTTDEVTLFDENFIPTSHEKDIQSLKQALIEASSLSRQERASSLGVSFSDPVSLKKSIYDRSVDWSQVRPEWGLAGNYAFIVAPRKLTRGISFSGRVFLHDYNYDLDENESTLELILSAPMVVASWINLQYYASTVNNRHFGSGDKTLHHISGLLGVIEGNNGDIRTGLPLQSLHDGNEWRHEPLRLHVCIQAPKEAIDRVLKKHPTVANLISKRWIHLFTMNKNAQVFEKSDGLGGWTLR